MPTKLGRLTKDKEFDRVFKCGRSSYNSIIGVKAIKNQSLINRVGLIISTKVSKKAVVRNKIRRRIREYLRSESGRLALGNDIVIIALPAIAGKNGKEVRGAVNFNLKRLRLIKGDRL